MNAQEQKPFEEILEHLNGAKKIVLMGCGGCATIFRTGGIKEVNDLAERLENTGKEVLARIGLPFGFLCCYLPVSSKFVEEHIEAFKACDAVLMMSCGDGAQTVREYLDEKGIVKPLFCVNNALGYSGGGPTQFHEECLGCGDCKLALTAGICPLTQCSKSLMNGPCGGVRPDGKCEVDPERDCAWVQIYKRLEKLGKVDLLLEMREPHDWSKTARPRREEVEPIDMMEELARTKRAIEALGVR